MLKFLKGFFKKPHSEVKSNTKILVVDDSAVDRRVISNIVKNEGYQVFLAENGESGVRMAREIKPDLILLDCEMPDIHGTEVFRRLRVMEDFKETPIVFITSVYDPTNILSCFDLYAHNYLQKPIEAKILIQEINDVLFNNLKMA